MRYMTISKYRPEFPLKLMCNLMHVSANGYRRWLNKPNCPRHDRDVTLQIVIKAIFQQNPSYGSPRIAREMNATGHRVSRKRVERLMREMGLDARPRVKRHKVVTTDSRNTKRIAPNLLERDFFADKPNVKWVGDITYIRTNTDSWLYLATVIDLFSRKVVGYAMGEHIDACLVTDALAMAVTSRQPDKGLIFHSDRGSQYGSDHFLNYLEQHGIQPSMSGRGDCYDNAVAESFFKTLKSDLIWRRESLSPEETRQEIFYYIESFYNRKRRHSTIHYFSPGDFEQLYTDDNDTWQQVTMPPSRSAA